VFSLAHKKLENYTGLETKFIVYNTSYIKENFKLFDSLRIFCLECLHVNLCDFQTCYKCLIQTCQSSVHVNIPSNNLDISEIVIFLAVLNARFL